MGQPRPLYCLFSFFSNTNYTEKTVGLSGIQTRIVGIEGDHAYHHGSLCSTLIIWLRKLRSDAVQAMVEIKNNASLWKKVSVSHSFRPCVYMFLVSSGWKRNKSKGIKMRAPCGDTRNFWSRVQIRLFCMTLQIKCGRSQFQTWKIPKFYAAFCTSLLCIRSRILRIRNYKTRAGALV